jgi:hypothetical protein
MNRTLGYLNSDLAPGLSVSIPPVRSSQQISLLQEPFVTPPALHSLGIEAWAGSPFSVWSIRKPRMGYNSYSSTTRNTRQSRDERLMRTRTAASSHCQAMS